MENYIAKLKTIIDQQLNFYLEPPLIIKKENIDTLQDGKKSIHKIGKKLFKLTDLIQNIKRLAYLDGYNEGLKEAYKENKKALDAMRIRQEKIEKELIEYLVNETKNHINENIPLYIETEDFKNIVKEAVRHFNANEKITITLPEHLYSHLNEELIQNDQNISIVVSPRLLDEDIVEPSEIRLEGRHSILELSILEMINDEFLNEKNKIFEKYFQNKDDIRSFNHLENLIPDQTATNSSRKNDE